MIELDYLWSSGLMRSGASLRMLLTRLETTLHAAEECCSWRGRVLCQRVWRAVRASSPQAGPQTPEIRVLVRTPG